MTLEELLLANIEATKEQTAELKRNSDFLEILTSKAKTSLAVAAEKTGADEKSEDKAAEPQKRAPAAKPAAKEAPKKKAKVPTPAEMAKATTDFLEVDDEDEFDARRALVKKILAKFNAPKMSEIGEDDRDAALEILTAYKAGDPTGLEEDEKPRRSRADDMA